MPLDTQDAHHLLAAVGYLELEMFADADAELDLIDADVRHLPEILSVRVHIYSGAKKWELMLAVAKRLAEYDPSNVEWTVNYAYALRRAVSLESATAVLMSAVERDAVPGIYHFNLACYHCQTGKLAEAQTFLAAAFKREKRFRQLALEDSDLEPLWKSL